MSLNPEDVSVGLEIRDGLEHADATEPTLIDSTIPIAVDGIALEGTDDNTKEVDGTNHRPWDFSNRKVIVQGVDKFHDVKTATKMLQKWLEIKPEGQVPFTIDKIKKPPKSTWMTVTLQSEVMVQPFIDYINTNSIRNRKGNKIFAKQQTSSTDHDRDSKRARSEDVDCASYDDCNNKDETHSKRLRQDRSSNKGDEATLARRPIHLDELKDRIIPLWRLTSEEQLQFKMKEMIKKCAMKIINEIKSKFRYGNETSLFRDVELHVALSFLFAHNSFNFFEKDLSKRRSHGTRWMYIHGYYINEV